MEHPRPTAEVRFQGAKLIIALLAILLLPYPGLYATARAAKLLCRWRNYVDAEEDHFIYPGRGRLSRAAFRVFTPLRIAEQKTWSWIEKR